MCIYYLCLLVLVFRNCNHSSNRNCNRSLDRNMCLLLLVFRNCNHSRNRNCDRSVDRNMCLLVLVFLILCMLDGFIPLMGSSSLSLYTVKKETQGDGVLSG